MDNAPLLHLRGIEARRRRRSLFAPLDLRLLPGERCLLEGPNGLGKTTLAQIVCGLRRPARGSLRRPEHLGYVPQEPRFPEHLKVQDYLSQLAALCAQPSRECLRQAQQAIALFQLQDATRHRIRTLSRGWKQRLNLARAWLGDPPLVVLDEPQTALDREGMNRLTEILDQGRQACLVLAPPGTGCETLVQTRLSLRPATA
ncbi:MAG: ABC transporter ATP-binding protein [Planctomycetota bacterium]|nr:MAG: ABC transporter ATP-binding protein [Planctomycetota bacterium]